MNFVRISLAAVGLCSVLLTVVVANAVFAPMPHQEKQGIGAWTTIVSKN